MSNVNDAFFALTASASFDSKKHAKEMRLFKEGSTMKTSVEDLLKGGGGDVKEGKKKAARDVGDKFAVSMPPMSLNFFGTETKAVESGGSDEENGSPTGVTDGGKNAVKPMTDKRASRIRAKHSIRVEQHGSRKAEDVPQPMLHFSELVRPPLSAPPYVVDNLFSREHRIPTPVQMQAIPTLIQGRDCLVCAPTGSGKTMAYLVPLFARLRAPDTEKGVRAVVVVPTMDLAMQVEREAFLIMKGGRWKLVQHGQTTKNKDLMITTPARLTSMIKEGHISLGAVEYLVFDEGDKLWDGGVDFIKAVDEIVAACTNPDKVVSLFSATLSKKVEGMAVSVMHNSPLTIIVNERTAASKNVEQQLLFTSNERGKLTAMSNMLKEGFEAPMLVFVQSIERTKDLHTEINTAGLHCTVMSGDMKAAERDKVVMNFRLGRIWILITTELLARGIDFKNVGTVVNYDFPTTKESYVHRIGRTGRAGKTGKAITFYTEDDKERLPMVVKLIHESGSPVEEWMLKLKTSKSAEKRLSKETPHRNMISNAKKQAIREKYLDKQYKRLRNEEEAKSNRKGRRTEEGDDDDSVSPGEL